MLFLDIHASHASHDEEVNTITTCTATLLGHLAANARYRLRS